MKPKTKPASGARRKVVAAPKVRPERAGPLHVEIVAVGRELLRGRRADANAGAIAEAVASRGGLVHRITIVDDKEIQVTNPASVEEALSRVPGLFVDRAGTGGFSSLYMRGAESSHVLIMIDGVKVNDPTTTRGRYCGPPGQVWPPPSMRYRPDQAPIQTPAPSGTMERTTGGKSSPADRSDRQCSLSDKTPITGYRSPITVYRHSRPCQTHTVCSA